MRPLLLLLVLLGVTVSVLHTQTGFRIVGIVMLVVPVLSLGWALVQHRGGALDYGMRDRLVRYVTQELPGTRGEVTLLMMAGYIGTVGGPLLGPVVAGAGIDLAALPTWAVLVLLVWLVPERSAVLSSVEGLRGLTVPRAPGQADESLRLLLQGLLEGLRKLADDPTVGATLVHLQR